MPPDLDVLVNLLVGFTIIAFALFAGYFAILDHDQQQALTRRAQRSASYFIPSDFQAGALDVASNALHAPDLWTLVKMTPGQVAATLGLDDKKPGRKVIDALVKVLHGEFHPAEIYVSGSFKKNTALKSRSDIDLVLKLNDFPKVNLADCYRRAVDALWQAFGHKVEVVGEPCSPFYVLTLFVADAMQFDVVFTCVPGAPDVAQKFRSASTSYIADEAIVRFSDSNELFRPVALLCKHWAYQMELAHSIRPKSYFVELFVMETIRRIGNNNSILESFLCFLQLIMGTDGEPVAVQNLNPNGTPKTISLQQWKDFASQASETFGELSSKVSGHVTLADMEPRTSVGSATSLITEEMKDVSTPQRCCLVKNESSRATMPRPSDLQEYFRCLEVCPHQVEHFNVWQGDHRYVCMGTYEEGPRRGQHCVVKWFKSGDVYEERFYRNDLLTVLQAAKIVDGFNTLLLVHSRLFPYKVMLNSPDVWTMELTGQKRLVEPYLGNFAKFNSNTGEVDERFPVMQALSHFSYQISGGTCLLCDVQGEPPAGLGSTFTLTDPVVCSTSKSFGPTDLGVKGIENFFYYHRCNSYCRPDWRRARGVPHFARNWGSLMAG